MTTTQSRLLMAIPYLLILGVIVLRVAMINPYNFTPVFACLLFFAAMRPAREFVLPLTALVGVDIFITTHRYGFPLTIDAGVTWAWYLIVMLLGANLLGNSRSLRRVAGCSLLASVSFFLVSNWAVWAVWQMYPRTLAGLEACYIAALPFFRNTLTSELCFSLLLFGLLSGAGAYRPLRRLREIARLAANAGNFLGVNHG
jgi:hypothetical protein